MSQSSQMARAEVRGGDTRRRGKWGGLRDWKGLTNDVQLGLWLSRHAGNWARFKARWEAVQQNRKARQRAFWAFLFKNLLLCSKMNFGIPFTVQLDFVWLESA